MFISTLKHPKMPPEAKHKNRPHTNLFTRPCGFSKKPFLKTFRLKGYQDLKLGPLDLQSNALPLSYTPKAML